MDLTEKDVKRISLILLIASLTVLVFLILRPVVLSIISGLILAYVFLPAHRWIKKYVKYINLSAGIVSIFIIVLILVPFWFILPVIVQQVFDIFQFSQNIDIQGFMSKLFPTISQQIIAQTTLTINNAITKLSSSLLNSLVDILVDFPRISLNVFLVVFVFFFTLRDEEKLSEFTSGLSPLNKLQERNLVKQFKDITNSLVYGQFLIGLVQGILAGIGFIAFGIPNALVLTVLAVILGVIPIVGPGLVYIPATFYLSYSTNPTIAIIFLAYNIIFVSTLDNLIRAHLISRKTDISQVIILIGMIGGLLVFGFLGLIIGPLVLAYFITFLKAYKEKTLSSLFADD
ncbi:MAG: AI-2E family transporter [Nanoarchaeota archaeon]